MKFNLMADIDPTAFTLFGIEIKWYAIMIVTGMLLGMLVSARLMSRRGEKGDIVIDFAIVVLPLAIIGARLYYMIFAPQEADRRSFWALCEFWNGLNGWGILVGLVLAFLVALLCVKINPLKFCRIQKPKEGDKLLPKGKKDWTVLTLVTVLLGLFLARICWLLADDPQGYIYRLFNIRGGGLAIYGGVILGAAGVIIVCVAKKFNWKKTVCLMDAIAPALILGQAIGRWGNFFNQEAYGQQITDAALQFFPYGVFIDSQQKWFQATFFYEFALNLIGFFVLFYLSNRYYKQKPGLIVCGYFVWYGLTRAVVEPLRSDSLYMGTFRVSQLLSFLLIAAGCILALMILWEKLSRYERGCGILACGCTVLFTLLWTLAEIISGFEFETYAAMTCLCLSVAVIGIVCAVLERRRLYLITGGALLLLGSLFLWGWGVTPYVIIAGAVLLIACVCVSFLFPRKPSEFDEEEVEGAEEAPVEENHE